VGPYLPLLRKAARGDKEGGKQRSRAAGFAVPRFF